MTGQQTTLNELRKRSTTARSKSFSTSQSINASAYYTAKLRNLMRKIGQASDRVARVRYAFLSIGRMAEFALNRCSPKLNGQVRERLEAVCRDIASLDAIEASLSNRI